MSQHAPGLQHAALRVHSSLRPLSVKASHLRIRKHGRCCNRCWTNLWIFLFPHFFCWMWELGMDWKHMICCFNQCGGFPALIQMLENFSSKSPDRLHFPLFGLHYAWLQSAQTFFFFFHIKLNWKMWEVPTEFQPLMDTDRTRLELFQSKASWLMGSADFGPWYQFHHSAHPPLLHCITC